MTTSLQPCILAHYIHPYDVPRTFKGYEEMHVPPAHQLPPPTEKELVKIVDLEDWAQLAFEGEDHTNTIINVLT